MDTTGAEALRQVMATLAESKATFSISRASTPLESVMKGYGLIDEIGSDRIYDTNRKAVAAFRRDAG
jgi:hypothetical protein